MPPRSPTAASSGIGSSPWWTPRPGSRAFRPNIVVATGPDQQGFVENEWIGHTLAIGDEVPLRITGPCPRCVMTTLPQEDLPKDAGILRAAAQNNQANVGVYADVLNGGNVRRGDGVTVA